MIRPGRRCGPVAAAICALAAALAAAADDDAGDLDGAALVIEKRCVACHHDTQMLLGPPYRTIAARHAAQKDIMLEVLAQKIILGGAGNWGVVPMVPNDHVTPDEARAIARWILDLQ